MKNTVSKVYIDKVRDISLYDNIRQVLWDILDKMNQGFSLSSESTVLVKVNLCLLKGPETGATCDPRVAKCLVEWLLDRHDVKKIFIAEADATHLGAEMAFQILGWYDFFKDVDRVEFLNLTTDDSVPVPGKYVKNLEMAKTMMEVDFFCSLAKLKTHTQQKITCTMKNLFGAIPYKYKIVYHPILAKAIYDATASRRPNLCLIDGLVAMEGNGPTNGIPKKTKLLIASDDPVSIDHLCARLMGFNPMSVEHLNIAINHGLGNSSYDIVGSPPNPMNLRFKFLPKWKEIAKKTIGLMQWREMNEEA